MHQLQNLGDDLIEVTGPGIQLAFLEQGPQAMNDLSSPLIVVHDVLENLTDFRRGIRLARQKSLRCLGIGQNRRERLTDLVGQGSG